MADQYMDYVSKFRVHHDEVACVVDHDTSTRIVRSTVGYMMQLHDCFLCDEKHWKYHYKLPVEPFLRDIQRMHDMYVPDQWKLKNTSNWQFQWLGYVYVNPKRSCSSTQSGSTDFSCTRDHQHERQVAAKPSCPFKGKSHLAARALRTLQMSQRAYSWTLWSMRDICTVAQERFQQLEPYIHPCTCDACGAAKPPAVSGRLGR